MSVYILDTDTLSLEQQGHPLVCQRISNNAGHHITITTITIQEQIAGWQGLLSKARTRQRIAAAHDFLRSILAPSWGQYARLSFEEPAILRFENLLTQRLNVGSMDLRIAAIALENKAIIVTRNHRDFSRVAGLVIEDWST